MVVIYEENGNLALFNGYKFRLDKKSGYYLSSKKIGDRRKRLHVYIWEYYYGKVPNGMSVHHKDEDKSHNDISNYELMTTKKHTKYHADEKVKNCYDDVIDNLLNNALPKAVEWHKSVKGSKWHKEHYQEMKDKLLPSRKFVCEYCHKEFESVQSRSKFCSNKCKSAYRRKNGVDNVEKICEKCGGKYIANKYSKTRYCEVCKNKKC